MADSGHLWTISSLHMIAFRPSKALLVTVDTLSWPFVTISLQVEFQAKFSHEISTKLAIDAPESH